jgi:nucleoside-diphosphate-sugar epimerase
MAGSIFLTGANGFLGSRVLSRLSGVADRKIVCLSRRKSAGNQCENVEFVQGDLLNREDYARALAGCDIVIHLAAATGKHTPVEYLRVNRDGTEALVLEARQAGVQRFLHVSTIAVKFRDKSRYYYAQSKQQAEAVVAQSGLRWTIVRPTIILGRIAPALESLSRLAALPVVPVFGDGRTLVQPVFVDDLAACLVAILEEDVFDGQTMEIGGPEVLSIEDLLLRIRRVQGGRRARVIHLPARFIATCLGWMEPFLGPLLPFTAGQLASFTNPGTITPDPWVSRQQTRMKNVNEILQSLANEHGPA